MTTSLEQARRIEFECYLHMKAHPESQEAYNAWRAAAVQLHEVRLQAPVVAAPPDAVWLLVVVAIGTFALIMAAWLRVA